MILAYKRGSFQSQTSQLEEALETSKGMVVADHSSKVIQSNDLKFTPVQRVQAHTRADSRPKPPSMCLTGAGTSAREFSIKWISTKVYLSQWTSRQFSLAEKLRREKCSLVWYYIS